ncbi:polymorphic toxin-type HINT domain-containing protein [Streptomyces sp. NPDC005803]|uniref:polymorphic toxin-type HINT domain-containing protein n=1 Tax=Streptomyces sp. NPDC005803 TaxID=3154297 RepID=UPI0033FB8B82
MSVQFNFGDPFIHHPVDVDLSNPPRWTMPPELAGVLWVNNDSPFTTPVAPTPPRRKFDKSDPFGVKRTNHANWLSHSGYIGGNDDRSSALIHLGAREYDPSTGRFLSADPVLDLADPVQMNGYVYCENNPVTFADPSGLMIDGGGSGGSGSGGETAEEAWANAQLNTTISDIIMNVGWAVFKEFIGWNDVVSCFSRGDMWACGSLIIDAIPWTSVFSKGKKIWRAVEKTFSAISAWRKAQEKARKIIAAAKAAREAAKAAAAAAKAAAKRAAQAAAKKAKQAATRQAKKAAQKTRNPVQKAKKAAAQAGEKVKSAAQKVTRKGKDDAPSSCSASNSFTPGTQVLMADGTTKSIEDVKGGDEVLATDPETGETTAEPVTAEIQGTGVKHLVEVTVDADSDRGTATATLTATDGHPFWIQSLERWVDATDLKPGQWLRTSAGTYVQVTVIKRWTGHHKTVHNLTVNDLHTYYVLAGTTPVLVHNCGARVVDMHGNDIVNPDALASRLLEHTNTALSEWNAGTIGFSVKDLARVARRPSRANTIKGNILDARVKTLADNDPALSELFSTPGGMPGPDWVNTGSSVPGVGWYDLTTTRMWGQHAFDYGPKYGPGVGILWQ